jgi:uncharacterized protein (TIGR02118 family)
MYQVVTIYDHPEDVEEFDKYFYDVHLPLAEKMPGVLRKTICRPAGSLKGGPPPYYLVAVLEFADEEALQTALTSNEGILAAADLEHFAGAGRFVMFGPASLEKPHGL